MADDLNIKISAEIDSAVKSVDSLAEALGRLRSALDNVDLSGLSQVATAAQNMGNAVQSMNGSARNVDAVARNLTQVGEASGAVIQTANAANNLTESVQTAAQATREVAHAAGTEGTNGFQRFIASLREVTPRANNAARGLRSMHKASKKASVTASGLAKELLRVGRMLKLMVTRMILRKIITGVTDGFKNLAQYSAVFNSSISLLWNSFRQLGSSIAAAVSPLVNALAPALNYIIQLVIKAVNAINQLISALLGLGVWTRAKTLTDSYADSLKKAGGAAKELKKTVLGFDELNQLQDNNDSGGGGGTSPADMFEQVAVDAKIKEIANKLLDPIKKAWDKMGDYVKRSWSKALTNLKQLGSDVARDFWEVWGQKDTVKLFENLFKTVGNIGQFVSNLAENFDKAWNKAEVGKRIIEDIRDLFLIISEHLVTITATWARWAGEVDFTPLLEGFEEFLDSLKNPVDFISGVVEDINTKLLQPLSKWVLETGLPEIEKQFADFNNNVEWDNIRDNLNEVWEALEPFAETVGIGLISFGEKLSKVSEGIMNSKIWDAIGWIASALGDLFSAFDKGDSDGLIDLWTTMHAITLLGPTYLVFGLDWSQVGEGLADMGAAIADSTRWNLKVIAAFGISVALLVANKLLEIKENVEKFFEMIRTKIELKFIHIRTTIKNKINEIIEDVLAVIEKVKSFFDAENWTFSGVAEGLKSTFESAVDGIKGIWNRFADSISGNFSIAGKSFSINLPRVYATGGFPEDGLFMANHNELVGRFSNGKTAVANNEQITDGIARAVYSAITAANSGGGSGASYINNTIEIDGVAIARAVTKGQRSLDRRYSPTMA